MTGLVEDLGGPESPGIGFAVGLERLIAVAPIPDESVIRRPDLFIAALGKEAQDCAFVLCNRLRMAGARIETDYGARSLKSQMKRADKTGLPLRPHPGGTGACRKSRPSCGT